MTRRTIGIDLGGTKIEGVVLDTRGEILHRERVPTEQEAGYRHILSRIAMLVERLEEDDPALPIGIGTPGSLSARSGKLKNSNTQCLNGQAIQTDLEDLLGRTVHFENDANCFALAEATLGAGRDLPLVFGVIMGTGVGGGIVIDGKIWSGPQHIGGEWGHHAIDPAGPHCYCGNRGCVEALLSGPALAERYHAAGGEAVDAQEVVYRAANGEERAGKIVADWIEVFGLALANLIDILDPSAVVLGGGLSNVETLYSLGREAVARRVFNDELQTPILQNQLGDSAGVIGAAILARSGHKR